MIGGTSLPFPGPAEAFVEGGKNRGDHDALEIGERSWTYADLSTRSARIADAITTTGTTEPLVAVLASRSLTAFAGSLAVFAAGKAHVALNPDHPTERNLEIVRQAGVDTIVVDDDSLPSLAEMLPRLEGRLFIIAPESDGLMALRDAHRHCEFVGAADVGTGTSELPVPEVQPDDLAYLVFTSGSTGNPKGVAISHGNLAVYMRNFRDLAAPTPDDRVATTYELTFDVALHDMFNTWASGATLCVVPPRSLLAPARFIRDERITYWFSVASSAMLMEQQGTLRPGIFPELRVSMLCGEPLPAGSAGNWAAAAPNSLLYNVYGPTETTMEMAFYLWDEEVSPGECRRGIVPIGIPFADHSHLLVDSEEEPIDGPGKGELLLAGPQVGMGYWQDEEKTSTNYVRLPGRDGIWYRTGDLVERDEAGLYHFISRLDHQVKVRGHRIELGEVEAALRKVAQTNLAVVIPHPVLGGNAQGLVAFVAGSAEPSPERIREGAAALLPAAMVPDRIELVDAFPLNNNRKIDRRALTGLLDA